MTAPADGPWRIVYDPEMSSRIWIDAPDHSALCCIQICDREDDRGETLIDQDWVHARLIAAIPEMLTALRAVSAIRPTNWDDSDDAEGLAAWKAVDDALAKTGR